MTPGPSRAADPDADEQPRRRLGRRQVLRGGAVALGGAGVGWSASALAATQTAGAAGGATAGDVSSAPVPSVATGPSPGYETVAFHGAHQAGVATPAQAHLSLVALDLRDDVDLAALARLMRLLSDDADRLALGTGALADTEPELAGIPSNLTVTFGFGPRVMDLVAATGRGRPLAGLPGFATDRLDPAWGQSDLVVQICADDLLTVAHARRMILKDAASFARLRWIQDGFRRARGSEAPGTTMRNVMGQVDGTVNSTESEPDFASLVWSDADDPGTPGGTCLVVRRIRARMDAWDRVDRVGKEFAVGRTLDNGAPLTGTREHDEPDFEALDATGFPVIDAASHVRRARSDDPAERFVRRVYNYAVARPDTGEEDIGLVFVAFAADPHRQFVPVQQRLADLDRLNQWVTTIGSAVYVVPPGAADGDYVGRSLLEG